MSIENDYGLISRDTLQRTANTIRNVLGISNQIYPPQFPDYIELLDRKMRTVTMVSNYEPIDKTNGIIYSYIQDSIKKLIKVTTKDNIGEVDAVSGYTNAISIIDEN